MPRPSKSTTMRWTPDDLTVIARLREQLGASDNTNVIRFAIRYTLEHGPLRNRRTAKAEKEE
jgi:hypothetical protein